MIFDSWENCVAQTEHTGRTRTHKQTEPSVGVTARDSFPTRLARPGHKYLPPPLFQPSPPCDIRLLSSCLLRTSNWA
jgi:hypothetical protein